MGLAVCPGAELRLQEGGSLQGGPARASHHFTAGALRSDGTQIEKLDGTTGYLISKRYEPHVVGDPFTGRLIQLLKPTQSGRALARPRGSRPTNTYGSAHLQVEWLYTPGMVRDGRRYPRLADTPMRGLEEFMTWCDSWSIPRVAPLAHLNRNPDIWYATAGHYEHGNTPSNDHWDIGEDVADLFASPQPTPVPPAPPLEETEVSTTIVQAGAAPTTIPLPENRNGRLTLASVEYGSPGPLVKVRVGGTKGWRSPWDDLEKNAGGEFVYIGSSPGLVPFSWALGDRVVVVVAENKPGAGANPLGVTLDVDPK